MKGREIAGAIFDMIVKIVVTAVVIMFVYRFSLTAYDFGYRLFGEEPMTQGEGIRISVTVSKDDSVRDVARQLEEKGLIRDANLFFIQELLAGSDKELNPGTYELNTSMTIEEMLNILEVETKEEQEE